MPAGSHVVAEIHYRALGEAVEDRSRLGVYFAQAPPAHAPMDLVVKTTEQKTEAASRPRTRKFVGSVQLSTDVHLLALKPEVQGIESVEVVVKKPDTTTDVLLLVRDVLPAWPTPYILKEPLQIPKNAELRVTYYSSPRRPAAAAGRSRIHRERVGRADWHLGVRADDLRVSG